MAYNITTPMTLSRHIRQAKVKGHDARSRAAVMSHIEYMESLPTQLTEHIPCET